MKTVIQINFCIKLPPKIHNSLVRCMERWKWLTFKTLIFGSFWGPEVVGSSSYQKNMALNLLIYIDLHYVRRSSWTVTTLATLIRICPIKNYLTKSFFKQKYLLCRLCKTVLQKWGHATTHSVTLIISQNLKFSAKPTRCQGLKIQNNLSDFSYVHYLRNLINLLWGNLPHNLQHQFAIHL